MGQRWGIILAGGEGKRMQPFIQAWLGENRPKQYCAFVGTRSMIGHTVDRAYALVAKENVVTIIARGHSNWVPAPMREVGLTIEQPRDAGAAPGVFLPLAHVLSRDPQATVVLLPADHFVFPEERFCAHIERACKLAEAQPDHVVLVGAVPDRPEPEYGWIRTAICPAEMEIGPEAIVPLRVTEFREKPSTHEARELMREECLWSTMVTAVKAQTLWDMGREHLPAMVERFDAFRSTLEAIHEGHLSASMESPALERLYRNLEPADFSTHILQRVPDRSLVLPMHDVDWCDWGRPHRVSETLARIGRRPSFPSLYFDDMSDELLTEFRFTY